MPHLTLLSQDKRFDLTPNTTSDEFMSMMREDRRTASIDQTILQLIFERVIHTLLALLLLQGHLANLFS